MKKVNNEPISSSVSGRTKITAFKPRLEEPQVFGLVIKSESGDILTLLVNRLY